MTSQKSTPNLQPTLRGELVELRPLKPADFDELAAVASDPLIWEQHPARDRYKREVFDEYLREGMACGGALVAYDVATGKMIGSSRYFGYNPEASEIEIGWTFLARQYWGGAHNRDMKKLMLEHAFGFVDTVVFLIGEDNIRSQKAVEKIGAKRVANRIDAAGRERWVYALSRVDFADFGR
jgi:RimJ/RimL family protein N-acetyltransferase